MEIPPDENSAVREPLLTTTASRGGFRTLPFILANETLEKVASYGLGPNMILYLTKEYHMEAASGATVLFIWSAATYFTPIIAAILADSSVGRYRMIGFGSIISLLGMALLWSTTMFPHCDQLSNICESPTNSQLLLLYSSFGLMSIGAGGIRSSSMAFGADQLNTVDASKNASSLQSYFSWYYATMCLSAAIAVTVIVYVQDSLGWKVGFGIPTLLMLLSVFSFFSASSRYVKIKPKSSIVTGFTRVLLASYRNRHIKLSSCDVYHRRKESKILVPTEDLRLLNKACVISSNEEVQNERRVCTIDQVEELKSLIRLVPIWSSGIMYSVTLSQGSFLVIQASSMDRHITPSFQIPAGSFSIFLVISIVSWIYLYDRVFLPLASKIKGKNVRLSFKQRMGIGLILSISAMASASIVERVRRNIASEKGQQLSAMWLLPCYFLSGLGEAFAAIGQTEFFYSELPESMGCISSNLFGLGFSAASLLASFITSLIDNITRRSSLEGKSWVSSDIDKGHYDYYFWVLVVLSFLNFFYFLACSRAYGPCKGDEAQISSYEVV